jgi:hypothetical protein
MVFSKQLIALEPVVKFLEEANAQSKRAPAIG